MFIWKFSLGLLAVGLAGSVHAETTSPPDPTPTPEILPRVEALEKGSRVLLEGEGNSPLSYELPYSDLKIWGELGLEDPKLRYLVLTGQKTDEVAERWVVLLRSTDGKIWEFTHPGRIFDPRLKANVYDGNAYLGKCLSRHPHALVISQTEKVGKKRITTRQSILVVEAGGQFPIETLIERRLPPVRKSAKCKELPSVNRTAKPMGFQRATTRTSVEEDKE